MLTNLIFVLFAFISVNSKPHEDHFAPSDIIELPVGRFPEPKCRYSVRHKDENGRIVREKVNIGDEIFHSWQCDYNEHRKNNYLFCVVVNNCTISGSNSESERERKIRIIDENGCSVFPNILPNVNYDGDLSAGIKVHAFSLDVETTAIHFTCNIRMIFKENDTCRRPSCKNSTRFDRVLKK